MHYAGQLIAIAIHTTYMHALHYSYGMMHDAVHQQTTFFDCLNPKPKLISISIMI
jgi:hypothetical protein